MDTHRLSGRRAKRRVSVGLPKRKGRLYAVLFVLRYKLFTETRLGEKFCTCKIVLVSLTRFLCYDKIFIKLPKVLFFLMNYIIQNLAQTLGYLYYILVYGVGIIAMVFSVIAVQFKRRITIILCNFIGQFSWVVYFILQADLASAISCALCAIMLGIFAKKDKWAWATKPLTICIFILIFAGFSAATFTIWKDIFPLLAGIFAVIANSQNNERSLRKFSLLWFGFWLLNSTLRLYPVAFANDLLCTVSAIVALFRFRKKENKLV